MEADEFELQLRDLEHSCIGGRAAAGGGDLAGLFGAHSEG